MDDELDQTSYALINDLLQNMAASVVIVEVKYGSSSSRKAVCPCTSTMLRIAIEKVVSSVCAIARVCASDVTAWIPNDSYDP